MDCLERNYAKIIAVNYDDFIDRLCLHKLQYQEHYGPEQRQNYAIKNNDVLMPRLIPLLLEDQEVDKLKVFFNYIEQVVNTDSHLKDI